MAVITNNAKGERVENKKATETKADSEKKDNA